MKTKLLRISIIFLFWCNALQAKDLTESDRFRHFLSQVILCGAETDKKEGIDCLKKSILNEPTCFKWMSDPDRLETLFQASHMESEAKPVVKKLRNLLQNNGDKIVKGLHNVFIRVDPETTKKALVHVVTPTIGIYLSTLSESKIRNALNLLNPEIFEQLYTENYKLLTHFKFEDIQAFSGFFHSVNDSTEDSNQRIKDLTQSLITEYLATFTNTEKSKILSEFLKQPRQLSDAERLRPLLQNLDPIMQKVIQLFGRSIEDPKIEEGVAILQSSIEPFPFEQMKEVIEARYKKPFDQLFKNYNPDEMRRATTGQVLFATTLQTQERVAIKVRIPEVLRELDIGKTKLLSLKSVRTNPGLKSFVMSLLNGIYDEFDYLNEAKYTDFSQSLYNDPARNISPIRRIKSFPAYSDLIVYSFGKGVKPTKLVTPREIAVRSKLIKNLIELWTETVFFKNIETNQSDFFLTTLFHGDLHPGNILIDPEIPELTILDFGNVGLFPIKDRRTYIRLYVASLSPNYEDIVKELPVFYPNAQIPKEIEVKLKKIAKEIWNHPEIESRMNHFLSTAVDSVNLPLNPSISSFMRAMAFLNIEADQIDALLSSKDPNGTIERVHFSNAMKRTIIENLKKEFPKTLFGKENEALIDHPFFKEIVYKYLKSRFTDPCIAYFVDKRKSLSKP